MSREVAALEYFVVGGAVQPDRPCYIERAADRALQGHVRAQRFAYVLAPRASGKSSLIAHAARELAAAGHLVAIIDLGQLAAKGEAVEGGRWVYSIANRIARQLRLRVDLQAWWQKHSGLVSDERLAEFFWAVVLAHTKAPVSIFIDEIERTLDVPVAGQLFAAIRGCYTNRATEPDYARLNFVVCGTATPQELCLDADRSPFELGREIALDDFSPGETRRLAPGFDLPERDAHELLDRIHHWTGGHPYLTQKVARGVLRRGGGLEAVERAVKEQFLMPAAAQGEPLLAHIRATLTQRTPRHRQALALLGKIARHEPVQSEGAAPAQQLLRLAGVVRQGEDGRLALRNPIFAAVFTSGWVHSALPLEWRRLALVAAVLFGLIAVPIWYVRYLPEPYIRTLSVAVQDSAVAEAAYEKLYRLPGFRNTADRLLTEVITRRSRLADDFEAVLAADARLRELPAGASAADGLLGEYWLRRAEQAVRAERRDEALLLASKAVLGQPARSAALMMSLIDSDYGHLVKTTLLAEAPAYWAVDWERDLVTAVDAAHRVQQVPMAPSPGARPPVPDRLTAVQHVPLTRELSVDAEGSAGSFALEVVVDHPRGEELSLLLEAPSGERAMLSLPQRRMRTTQYTFHATARTPLARLVGESRRGTWRLIVTDRSAGNTGTLREWGLRFDGSDGFRRDIPEQGIAIPDPVRTEQIRLELSDDGRLAIARPARPGAVGALTVWDLQRGRRRMDLALDAEPSHIAIAPDGSRLVVVAGSSLTIWPMEGSESIARIATQSAFAGIPVLDSSGRFLLMAEALDGSASLVRLLRLEDGALLASMTGPPNPTLLALGPDASYLAVVTGARRLRVLDPATGRLVAEWDHGQDLVRLLPAETGRRVFGVDAAGELVAWQIAAERPREAGSRWRIGATIDPASVSVAPDGRTVAYEAEEGQILVRDALGEREALALRVDAAEVTVRTRLGPDGRRLFSLAGARAQWWELPNVPATSQIDAEVSAISADASGRQLAIGFRDGRVRFRGLDGDGELAPAAEPVDFIGHQGAVTALAMDLRLRLAASGGADGVVRLWDMASGAPRPRFLRHPVGPIHAVALSPDGRWVASAAEYSARLWRADDGELIVEVPVNGAASALAFAPSARVLAVGDRAGNVFFADPEGGDTELRSLRAPAGVSSLGFGPSPDLLLVGDDAGQLQLWHLRRAEPVFEATRFRGRVRRAAFEPAPGYVIAQTDHWLHRLAISSSGLAVQESRLAPIGAHAEGTALGRDGEVLLVGHDAFGRPEFERVRLGDAARVADIESPLSGRDWSIALGIGIAADGRIYPLRP